MAGAVQEQVQEVKEYAQEFYKSRQWNQVRKAYIASKRGWCERCLERGMFTPAEIVHHKVWITPENINDPEVTLNFQNLKAVCRNCHAEEHEQRHSRRYSVSKDGAVQINTGYKERTI